ncbi:MFS transporter [Paenibacillus sediminis]|uniref:MFS family permease n=1 Tax=Paenibacillus sediminis TaxID=664909 RepID=A0ABS4H6D4_9BACL|nr:MFS transporter [Paenibacillus sediminis]MBP1938098.1 MFS family permease [Paenibacillus sediminis]
MLELTVLLFEMPTGIIADTYSRRLSVIIGILVIGFAYVLEGSIPYLSHSMSILAISLVVGVLAAEAVRGIGETFNSGSTQAWLTDEIGDDKIGDVFLRSNQLNQIVGIIGVIASVGLYERCT